MKFHYSLILLALSTTLASCSEKPQTQEQEHAQGVISNAQQHTLDKAKATEDVLKKADEERLKKIDEMTPEQ
jgi:hypothetical protein